MRNRVVKNLTLLRISSLMATDFENFLIGVVECLPAGQRLLPFGRLRVCGTKFDARHVVVSNPTIYASLASLIDFDCSPSVLQFKRVLRVLAITSPAAAPPAATAAPPAATAAPTTICSTATISTTTVNLACQLLHWY